MFTLQFVSLKGNGKEGDREKLESRRESLEQTCQCAEPRWPELR